ncbi:bifunctional adenosylcobinamide kinase/adenosylcobinamide-phosphate guanylyltransferase [uncultured Methylobacterium sp.]|uniref:bifunctional adenosylcobinamide kinase/adenosylcobinamide-phosphate guanylyltransferase n=1 Tax=uncultured Methylobacterium sp. TaxID=157278 RepID=UPI0035CC38D8
MQQAGPRTTLVLGGARSGKSAYAEALIEATPTPWLYLATAQGWDDEMRARIALHRERRPAGWITRDVPLALPAALAEAQGPVLVDCLTLWLTNLLLSDADLDAATDALSATCAAAPGPVVLVSNEVGLGIVPDNALARRFRDAAGRLHQRLAREVDRVVLTVAGLPLTVKPQGTP